MTRRAPVLLCIAALCLMAGPPAASAKKKGKRGGTVDITKVVNLPIPDSAPGATGIAGLLRSTIDVGKQFKGREIRDVNVTIQTLGTSGTAPAGDLEAKLAAPNGAHTFLVNNLLGPLDPMTFMPGPNPSIGPLTLDDESPLSLGSIQPRSPFELYMPWAGTAQPAGNVTLAVMDGGRARGTWTLTMIDTNNPATSNLVSWRLSVVTGVPFKTK